MFSNEVLNSERSIPKTVIIIDIGIICGNGNKMVVKLVAGTEIEDRKHVSVGLEI